MKNRLLSALLTFCLMLTLLPIAAQAAPSNVRVGNVTLNSSTPYWRNGESSARSTDTAYNAYYDATTGTLTLRNANVSTAYSTGNSRYGIFAAGDLTLVLEGGSQVGGASLNLSTGNSYGVYASGINISGSGSLVATGGDATGDGGKSYGLYSETYMLIGSGAIRANTISTGSVAQAMNIAPMYYDVYGGGGYLVKAGADESSAVLVDNPGTDTNAYTRNRYVSIVGAPPASTPSATFSFDGSNAGELMGTTAQMKYSLDGGSTWVACSAASTDLSSVLGSIGEDYDIEIKDMGNGINTSQSLAQTIDITQASSPTEVGKVNCATISNNDGKLTGVTTAMEYKLSTAGAWTGGTGSDITGLGNGTYLVRVKATGTVRASEARSLVISAYSSPASTPSATFSFDGPNAGKLMGTTAQMKYSVYGGTSWVACSAPSTDLSVFLSAISQVNDLRIKDMGNGVSTTESQVQVIDITKASTPTAGKADCTTLANNDGKLTGVTTAMEYKLSTAGVWTSGTGSDITGLGNGTYQVRVKATGTVLASDARSLVINGYVGAPAATPSVTFSFDGANAGQLLGTTAQTRYSLNGGSTWIACAAPSTDLSGVLGSINGTSDIKIKDMGDGISTTESPVQTIDITQASTPTAGKTDCTTLANNDGKLTGVTTAMEYKLSTAGVWTSGTGNDITGLGNGTYQIRVKATGTVLASDAQSLSINAYVGTQATTPSATFSFDGANAGQLMGTTAQMRYSLDGGNTWIACAAPSTDLSGVLGSISRINDLMVKDMGNGVSTTQSQVQTIDITQAVTPTAGKLDCTTLANNDGKLTGVTNAMEYKLSTAGLWTSGTGSDITGLGIGTYQVRVKATGTVLASDVQSLVISAYIGTPATTPSATFSFDGANAGQLLGTTAQMRYSLDGGSTWIACSAAGTDLSSALGGIDKDSDIKVKDLGDGISTTESQVQTIDITKASTPTAGKTDCATLANNDGKLTGVTNAMEYKPSTAGVWTSGTGSDITGLGNGTYQVRVKATGTVLASDVQSLVISAYVGTQATTPSATFSFDGPNAGKLMGTTAQMKYSVYGGTSWVACSAPSTDLSVFLSAISQVNDLRIKDMGNGVSTTESQAQVIDITKASTPTAGKADCTTLANSDGKLTGVTNAMEYKLSTAGVWTSGTGSDIAGLGNGTYQVRVKATGTVLASDAQSLVINAYVGTPATTPSATFSFDGANAGQLMGTTAQMRYSLNGGGTWIACSAASTDLSSALGGIDKDNDIKVKDLGDGISTTESQVQTIDITQASTPTAGKTDCTTLANNDGRLTGVTTAMEYKLSTAGVWTSGTGNDIAGLPSGTYQVRVKATGTVLASDTQSVTINAYSGTPASKPSATFSFDGTDAGKLMDTSEQMQYSLDGGSAWIACAAGSTDLSGVLGSIGQVNDLKIKDLGDGVTTTESPVQTIDITQAGVPTAGKADCTTLVNNDGKLTGVTTAMEYKLSTAGLWTSGTGSDITGLASGTYQVRVKATGTVLASAAQSIIINAYSGAPATTPSATFSFDGANAGHLLDTTAQMEYSLDGGSAWIACSAGSTDLSGALGSIDKDHDILIKDRGDGVSTTESLAQTIDITQADRPSLAAAQPSSIGGNGSIPMTVGHEYRLTDAAGWTAAAGSTSLAAGTYLVRVKTTGTTLASDAQSITLTAFTGSPASTPAAVVDYAVEQLTNLTADGNYAVNGSDVSADGGGQLAIDNDWWGTTVSLVKKGDGVTTNDSEVQSIALAARPATPACTATQPSASSATGRVSGITAAMQYSVDGGTNWTDGSGNDLVGLTPGTVLIRVKATDGAPTGRSQSITITAYSPPPSDNDSGAGDSGGSSNPGSGGSVIAPITEISSGDSVTDSNLKQLVTSDQTLTVSGVDGAQLLFDAAALEGIADQASSEIVVELQDVSAEHQNSHPGKRVFTLTVSSDGETITDFGGSVTVTLPYQLQDGEAAEDVTVWYLADDGTLTEIPCVYDPVTGLATFQVSHFSRYLVGTPMVTDAHPEVHFSDVHEGDWYYGAVAYVAERGLIGATGGTAFSPNSGTTRGMIATILWRLEQEPQANASSTFVDVSTAKYYCHAISWAAENDIVGGYPGDRFRPDDNVTREQLASILYRYARYKGIDVSCRDDLAAFADQPSTWARATMQWAVAEGLIGSAGGGKLDPVGITTRAQLAAILQRLIESVLK